MAKLGDDILDEFSIPDMPRGETRKRAKKADPAPDEFSVDTTPASHEPSDETIVLNGEKGLVLIHRINQSEKEWTALKAKAAQREDFSHFGQRVKTAEGDVVVEKPQPKTEAVTLPGAEKMPASPASPLDLINHTEPQIGTMPMDSGPQVGPMPNPVPSGAEGGGGSNPGGTPTGGLGDLVRTVDPAAPVPTQLPPEIPPAAAPPAEAIKASASMQAGAGFQPMGIDPRYDKDYAAAVKAHGETVAEGQKQLDRAGKTIQQGQERAAGLILKNEAEQNHINALLMENHKTMLDEASRYDSAAQQSLDEAARVSAVSTDPGRFWRNKSDGQKAASVLAGFLFGFTGQGMDYLKRIDALVNEDVRMQEADRSARVAGLEAKAKGAFSGRDFAMAKGASGSEALRIESAMKYEQLKTWMNQISLETQNAEVGMRMQQAQAGLAAQQANLVGQGKSLAIQNAHMINSARAENAKIELEKLRVSAAMAKGAVAKPPPSRVQADLTKIIGGREAAQGLLKRLEGRSTLTDVGMMLPGNKQTFGRNTEAEDFGMKNEILHIIGTLPGNTAELRNRLQEGVGLGLNAARTKALLKDVIDQANAHEAAARKLQAQYGQASGESTESPAEEASSFEESD